MKDCPKIYAVILAAGSSRRMNCAIPKQRMMIDGKSVLRRSAEVFDKVDEISGITIVCCAVDLPFAKAECQELMKPVSYVIGGENRFDSAKNGFCSLPADTDFVAIHDAARCLVTQKSIKLCLENAVSFGAASLVGDVNDTVKTVKDGEIQATLDRNGLKLSQTPQIFRTDWYREAISYTQSHHLSVTDDNEMLEIIGKRIRYVENPDENPKLTTKKDVLLAEALLKVRKEYE